MRILIVFTLCLLHAAALTAQQKFTVHGKITMLTKSKNIHLGNYTIPIQNDGTFELNSEVPTASEVFMRTDSSYLMPVWMEAENYTLACSESRSGYGKAMVMSIVVTEFRMRYGSRRVFAE